MPSCLRRSNLNVLNAEVSRPPHFYYLMQEKIMTIVFWVILVAGTISATNSTAKLNALCKKEVEEGTSVDIRECKQYYFDTRIKTGW